MRSLSISSLSQTWYVAKNGLDLLFSAPHFPSARFACVCHGTQFTKLWEANAELTHARPALYQLSKASQSGKLLLTISLESTLLYPFSIRFYKLSSVLFFFNRIQFLSSLSNSNYRKLCINSVRAWTIFNLTALLSSFSILSECLLDTL